MRERFDHNQDTMFVFYAVIAIVALVLLKLTWKFILLPLLRLLFHWWWLLALIGAVFVLGFVLRTRKI